MTSHTPPTDQQLDAIKARAMAATDGPWGVYQFGGDSLIEIAADLEDTGTGYRARRTICRFDEEPLDNDPTHAEWTGEEDWAQVQADAAFVGAVSPEVVKTLVAEVRRLRARQLTASEYNAAWHAVEGAAGQEGADPGTVLHAVLDRLGIEWQTAAHPAAVPAAVAPDTLPAWLHRRFSGTAVTWDALDSDERAYWEHQAAAVRRAVARGGFKTTRPAVRPAVETGARPTCR